MTAANTRYARRPMGLVFGCGLALLFLAACGGWIYGDLAFALEAHKITGSIEWQPDLDVLTRRVAAFLAATVFVHLLLGAAAWGLARLTAAALPRLDARHDRAVIFGWFALLALLAIALNGSWYPQSQFAGHDGAWQEPLTIVSAVAGLAAAALVAGLSIAAWARRRAVARRRHRGAVVVAAVATIASLSLLQGATGSPAAADFGRPHVVILGVDSLRNDMSEATLDGRSLTPHIDRFLQGAHRFSDATSPLARTYGSWVAILTGRHPVSTNARFNLMPRHLVREGDTLADALRAAGYRSVYATDEVRFANFDQSYGFDQLITPPVGASDFLLGTIGDLPLVNLVTGSPAGNWLFPANHANRAAYATYDPGHFVARLDDELEVRQPSLLAIHLTLAHWPYSWAGQVAPSTPPEYRDAYRQAIAAVDRQFDAVVGLLRRKGVLDNAIVVVLSDHGEALGFPSDTMLRKTGRPEEIWNSIWGHGTSVMSPHQYGVLLSLRAFGRATLPGEGRVHDWPVSLEDIRPTLEEVATGRAPGNVDGLSLLPYLAGTASASVLEPRLRYTETCFNTPMMLAGRIDASGLVTEAIEFYELAPESGWVQLRENRLPELMAKKQRAVLSRDALLAAVPSWKHDSVSYLYTSRQSPFPQRLENRPDPSRDAEAARLWDALHARFPGELPDLPE